MVEVSTSSNGVSRRTMIKGAAWSLPVIGLAAATPMAAASTGTANVAWTGGATTLLTLNVLDAGDVISASVLPSAPTVLGIQNGATALPNVTITVATAQNPGLGLSLGIGTVLTTRYVATDTSRTFTLGNVAANQTLSLPVTWGATAPSWTGLGIADISLLTSYAVTVTFRSNGTTLAQLTSPGISIPAVAGLL